MHRRRCLRHPEIVVRRRGVFLVVVNETSTTAATDLTALAAGPAGFLRRPLVGSALLVGRSTALAGDLLLTFGAHRRETAPLFTFARHVNLLARRTHRARTRAVLSGSRGNDLWTAPPHDRRATLPQALPRTHEAFVTAAGERFGVLRFKGCASSAQNCTAQMR